MAGLLDQLVSGVVDAALKEVLKKTGLGKATATKRTRRKTATRKKASGGLLGDIIDAALKPEKKPAKRPRKQVSRRRTAATRSSQRSK